MFLYLAGLNFVTNGGNKHIGLPVDECSRLNLDLHIAKKNDLWKKLLHAKGDGVTGLRCVMEDGFMLMSVVSGSSFRAS